jgi:tetratricopeptide (TPR) repeat protein
MKLRFAMAVVATAFSLVLLRNVGASEDVPSPKAAAEAYDKADWAKAARAYQMLAEQHPDKGLYRFRLGACRLALKEYKPALADFETALTRGAPEGQVRYNMARARAGLGEKDAALACLEKSATLGFAKAAVVRGQEELAPLRGEPRFQAVLDKLEHPTKGLKGADAMDHWIGEWDVYVGSQRVGQNRIVKNLDGYAVEEFWENANGGRGRSLFVFLARKGEWKQLWSSDAGWIVEKVGTPIENGIYLEGTSTFANGQVQKSRERLTRNADGSVRQLLQDWDEETKTWKTTFDGKYVRKPGAARPE